MSPEVFSTYNFSLGFGAGRRYTSPDVDSAVGGSFRADDGLQETRAFKWSVPKAEIDLKGMDGEVGGWRRRKNQHKMEQDLI